jgi:hypothetical protein
VFESESESDRKYKNKYNISNIHPYPIHLHPCSITCPSDLDGHGHTALIHPEAIFTSTFLKRWYCHNMFLTKHVTKRDRPNPFHCLSLGPNTYFLLFTGTKTHIKIADDNTATLSSTTHQCCHPRNTTSSELLLGC